MKQKQTKTQAKNAEELEKWLAENLPHITIKDKSEYKNNRTPITFFCQEHGECVTTSMSIKQSKYGCKKCGVRARTLPYADFVTQAKSLHGDKYSYYEEKEAEWQGNNQTVKIYCKKCEADFSQFGFVHLEGRGCSVCSNRNKQLPYADFVTQAKSLHGEKYLYYEEKESGWQGSHQKVKIFCSTCQKDFSQLGNSHLQGQNCPVCNNRNKQLPYTDFVARAKSLHGKKYSYYAEKESRWKGSHQKVKIYCKKCQKTFWQVGYVHLNGSGCPSCNVGSGIDSEKNFLENPELAESDCYLYYVKIADSYKIGITNNIAQRFAGEQYELLNSRKTTRLYAWRAEQMILWEFAEYKQKNDKIRGGGTECFGTDISQFDNFDEYFNHNFVETI